MNRGTEAWPVTRALRRKFSPAAWARPQPKSLVPDTPSSAPDYFCTWNIQGYIASYPNTSDAMRAEMIEENIFGDGQYQGWAVFFPAIRSDLYFVMDDSWDIPRDKNARWGNPYYGTMELSEDRFPSFKGAPAVRLKALVDSVKSKGWKGLGGWVCAQEAENAMGPEFIQFSDAYRTYDVENIISQPVTIRRVAMATV